MDMWRMRRWRTGCDRYAAASPTAAPPFDHMPTAFDVEKRTNVNQPTGNIPALGNTTGQHDCRAVNRRVRNFQIGPKADGVHPCVHGLRWRKLRHSGQAPVRLFSEVGICRRNEERRHWASSKLRPLSWGHTTKSPPDREESPLARTSLISKERGSGVPGMKRRADLAEPGQL